MNLGLLAVLLLLASSGRAAHQDAGSKALEK